MPTRCRSAVAAAGSAVDAGRVRHQYHAGGDGNDWFRANYNSKAKSVPDTTDGGWTRHSESHPAAATPAARVSKTAAMPVRGRKDCARRPKRRDPDLAMWSAGNCHSFGRFRIRPSTPCGCAGRKSCARKGGKRCQVTRTPNWGKRQRLGGSGDESHVLDESDGEWEDNYDNGTGSTEINKSESKSKYKLDDVYSSSYGGDPSATLDADGSVTASGSSHAEEDSLTPSVVWLDYSL